MYLFWAVGRESEAINIPIPIPIPLPLPIPSHHSKRSKFQKIVFIGFRARMSEATYSTTSKTNLVWPL